MKPFTLVQTVILFCSFLFLRCSDLAPIAGATDMPNETASVSAVIHDSAGEPVYRAAVIMTRADYLAPLPQTAGSVNHGIDMTLTDESGRFVIDSLDSGSYMIEVNDRSSSACRIHCTIGNDTGTKNLGTFAVQPYAAITGTIDTLGTSAAQRYIQIYGLNRIVPIEKNGTFNIIDLPADLFTIRIVSINSAVKPIDIGDLRLNPGETKNLYAPWGQSMKINVNTTLSGAGVAGNVYRFPVLVRLNATNFNFSSAQIDGRDIRFTKSDNTMLPYEIERWDAVAGRAEVWVKLDTVYGNDSSHYFVMYWGNPNAMDESNGASIFDTANGFQGVWHLAEPGNSTPGGYRDATVNACNLSGTNRSPASGAEGMIGGAQGFDTIPADSITGPCPATINGNASFTASFWVKIIALKPSRPDLLDFGAETYLAGCHFLVWPDLTVQFGMYDTGTFTPPNGPEPRHQNSFSIASYAASWMQVTTVYNAAEGTLAGYINGTLIKQKSISAIQLDPKGGLHIGKPYNYAPGEFSGTVDEVRVLSIPLSQDWIKLDYENQRKDGMLVRFY